jgi:Protein of unknown function (DUF4038)/Domain of unknown function (DUF5060)
MWSSCPTLTLLVVASVLLPACGGAGDATGVGGAGALAPGFSVAGSGGQASAGASSVASAGGFASGGSGPSGGTNASGASTGGAESAGSNAGGTAGFSGAGGGPPATGVEQWHPVEIKLGGTSTSQLSDRLSATFTGPVGEKLVVPGFFDGLAGWKVRFSPTAIGAWSYTTSSSIAVLSGKTGAVQCVANTNPLVHGRLRVDAAHPHYFAYEDGTPYVLMAFEADWLGLLDFGDAAIPKAKSLVDMYTRHGFNQVLMNVFAYDTGWKSGKTSSDDFGPPAEYPWQGSNAKPDQSQMNPAFFANYDLVMQYLFEHGVVAHIMLKVYNKDVKWPAKGSAEDDLYFNHLLARYQSYPNLLWDFSKESNNEADATYKSDRLKLIHETDAYQHPVSTHTDVGFYASAASKDLLDFRTDQNQDNWYDTIVAHQNAKAWPVFNSEYDYELGNDGGKTYGHATEKLTCFKRACEVTMAGAGFAYYYTYHAWDVVRSSEVPGGLGYYKQLFSVISATKWSELSRADDLIDNPGDGRHCLARPGAEYLVYLAGAGSATLNVKQVPNTVQGKWLNLISGQQQAIAAVGNGSASLTNPWSEPAMAHLSL